MSAGWTGALSNWKRSSARAGAARHRRAHSARRAAAAFTVVLLRVRSRGRTGRATASIIPQTLSGPDTHGTIARMRRLATVLLVVLGIAGCGREPSRPASTAAGVIRVGYFPNLTHAQALAGLARGDLSLIHISEPTRLLSISYAV